MNAGDFGVFGVFNHRQGGDHSDRKGENSGGRIAKYGSLTQPNWQANPPVTVELDVRLACRRR